MVQISQGATEVLSTLRSSEGIPESYGVRFYSETDREGATAVGIAFAQGPATGDEVIVAQELPVFVAADVASELGDAVLDVEGVEGPGGGAAAPRFVIRSEGPA